MSEVILYRRHLGSSRVREITASRLRSLEHSPSVLVRPCLTGQGDGGRLPGCRALCLHLLTPDRGGKTGAVSHFFLVFFPASGSPGNVLESLPD
jgi:hypothetical protein